MMHVVRLQSSLKRNGITFDLTLFCFKKRQPSCLSLTEYFLEPVVSFLDSGIQLIQLRQVVLNVFLRHFEEFAGWGIGMYS